MNAENPSTSKFQLVTETLLPHKCLACGINADGRLRFVDFGLSLDEADPLYIGVPNEALGVIYICENCAREIAIAIGAMPPTMTNQVLADMETRDQELVRKENEIERLRALNASYVTVLSSLGAVDSDDVQDDKESDEGDSEPTERTDNIFTRTES